MKIRTQKKLQKNLSQKRERFFYLGRLKKYLSDQKTAKALQEAEKIVQEQNRKQVLKNILNIENVATTQEKVVDVKKEAVKIVEEEIIKTKAEKKAELIKDIKFALIKANIKQQEEFKNINKFKLFVDYLGENSYKTLQNLYEPLKKAGDKNADSVWAYLRTQDQGLASTVFQLAGNTAGGTAGFVGTATGGAITEIIKAVGWDDELTELSNKFLGTGAGQALIEAISKGEAGMAWLEKNYPEAARNLKALLGTAEFAALFVGGSLLKGGGKLVKTEVKSVYVTEKINIIKALKNRLRIIKANNFYIKSQLAKQGIALREKIKWEWNDTLRGYKYLVKAVKGENQLQIAGFFEKSIDPTEFGNNVKKAVAKGSGGVSKIITNIDQIKNAIFNNPAKLIGSKINGKILMPKGEGWVRLPNQKALNGQGYIFQNKTLNREIRVMARGKNPKYADYNKPYVRIEEIKESVFGEGKKIFDWDGNVLDTANSEAAHPLIKSIELTK